MIQDGKPTLPPNTEPVSVWLQCDYLVTFQTSFSIEFWRVAARSRGAPQPFLYFVQDWLWCTVHVPFAGLSFATPRSRLCCAVYECKCVCGTELQRLVELILSYCSVTARYTCLFHTVTSSAHTGVPSTPPGQSPTCPYFLFPLCLFSLLFSIVNLLSPFLPHRTLLCSFPTHVILFFCFSSLLACMSLSLHFLFLFSFFFHPELKCPWIQETFSLLMGFCLCILPPRRDVDKPAYPSLLSMGYCLSCAHIRACVCVCVCVCVCDRG